jgi:amino acid adenylation domain-containing protein
MTTTEATNTTHDLTYSEQRLQQAGAVFGPRTNMTFCCLHTCVEQHAAASPASLALLCEAEVQQTLYLSYGSLNRRANALAHTLRTSWGVTCGELVGVCLEPSLEGIIAFLALGKLGAVPLFLDPAAPIQRLAYLLSEAACHLLLHTGTGGSTVLTTLSQEVLYEAGLQERKLLALDNSLLTHERAENPEPNEDLEALTYVIATSGSTGEPKAVPIRQRGFANHVSALADLLRVQPGARVLNPFSLHFDAAMGQIGLAFWTGATLCLGKRAQRSGGRALLSLLRQQGITHAAFTPSLLATLPPDELPELRSILCGGERCAPGLVELWGQGRQFVNIYGPTECTVGTTVAECSPTNQTEPGELPIGRPMPNTWVCILDKRQRPLPRGRTGEIAIGGLGVSPGYLHRPDLSANQFFTLQGCPCYRTGDRGRIDADGVLWYRGRIAGDLQVKLAGGRRFDLGELEARLLAHPAILACAVAHWNGHLVTYLVQRSTHPRPTVAELRAQLLRWVPAYAVPQFYLWQQTLPMTSGGKIDRGAFEPEWSAFAYDGASAEPRTPTEQALAKVLTEVLAPHAPAPERMNALATFAEVGLDSLSVLDLLYRTQDRFGVDAEVEEGQLLQLSIETFAQLIDERRSKKQAHEAMAILDGGAQ